MYNEKNDTDLLWRMSWIRLLKRITTINITFIALAGVSFTLDIFIARIKLNTFLMS